MNAKRLIAIAAYTFLAYRAGKMVGHLECMRNLVNKYGDEVLKNEDMVVDDGKHWKITIKKSSKKENSDL